MEAFYDRGILRTRGDTTKPLVLTDAQLGGVSFMQSRAEGILNIPMGGGKTLTSLSFVALQSSPLPTIVLCPSSTVHSVWRNEVERCTNLASKTMFICEKNAMKSSRSGCCSAF